MINRILVFIITAFLLCGCGKAEIEVDSKNTISGNTISGSDVSGNSIGGNTISENLIMDDSVSGNETQLEADGVSGESVSEGNVDGVNTIHDKKRKTQVKVKGIYVTGPMAGNSKMRDLISLVENTELNTMVIDIKNDEGNITYNMDLASVQDSNACQNYVKDMKGLLNELHEKNIYVIGRIVCFKDPVLAANRTDLKLCKPDGKAVTDGNGLEWVNPYKEDVWDYLCSIAEQAVLDGFDEIQFDYVRFPIGKDANAADYGVDTESYTRQQGLDDFFAYASKRLHEKDILFGADLFGTVIGSDVDRRATGQDYVNIASVCDNICPMVYPSHYANGTFGITVPDADPYGTIYGAMSKSMTVLTEGGVAESATVRPWLQCFTASWVTGHISYDAEQIAKQIDAVYDAGYEEFILWNAQNRYGQVEDGLKKVKG